MISRLILAFIILSLFNDQPACAGSSRAEVRVSIEALPLTLDPHRMSESHEFRVAQDLFEGLTTESANGTVIPGVAKYWSVSPDGMTWTFRLRANEKWSDGSPLTASDFVYSFHRAIDPAKPSPAAEVLRPIAGAEAILSGRDGDPCSLGVKAVNARTLEITLARPTPWLPALLAHFVTMPVPQAAIDAYGDDWTKPGHIIGNGAYRLVKWTPGGEMELERNPYFHDVAHVQVANVYMAKAPEPDQALAALQSGAFDVVDVTGPTFSVARARWPGQVVTQTELSTTYVFANVVDGPTRWPALRRALSMVLDRETLIHEVEQADHAPAYELIARGAPGYTPARVSWAATPLTERIKLARRLIDDPAREIIGPSLQLTFRDSAKNRVLASAIVETWRLTLSFKVDLRPLPEKAFLAALNAHDFQLALVGWDPDFADPDNTLSMFRSNAGEANFGRYANPRFDALLDKADTTRDLTARAAILREAEQLVLDESAVIPIQHGVVEFLTSPRLKGWIANPLARHPSRFLAVANIAPKGVELGRRRRNP